VLLARAAVERSAFDQPVAYNCLRVRVEVCISLERDNNRLIVKASQCIIPLKQYQIRY